VTSGTNGPEKVFARDRRQNRRCIKKLRALGDDLKAVLDRVAVVALDTHEHLRLKIDQQQRRVVG
jgi:hypothetical protein